MTDAAGVERPAAKRRPDALERHNGDIRTAAFTVPTPCHDLIESGSIITLMRIVSQASRAVELEKAAFQLRTHDPYSPDQAERGERVKDCDFVEARERDVTVSVGDDR
jgi:hypothetical protein